MDGLPACAAGSRSPFRPRCGTRRDGIVVTGTERRAWPDWPRRHGIKRAPDATQRTFEELYFAVQAALDSLGVALVPSAIVAEEIRARRLVALASPDPAARTSYALLAPRRSTRRAAIRELADWLRTQADTPAS